MIMALEESVIFWKVEFLQQAGAVSAANQKGGKLHE